MLPQARGRDARRLAIKTPEPQNRPPNVQCQKLPTSFLAGFQHSYYAGAKKAMLSTLNPPVLTSSIVSTSVLAVLGLITRLSSRVTGRLLAIPA